MGKYELHPFLVSILLTAVIVEYVGKNRIKDMDIHKKFRLIGYYNKPKQNMHEELVFVAEATKLANY